MRGFLFEAILARPFLSFIPASLYSILGARKRITVRLRRLPRQARFASPSPPSPSSPSSPASAARAGGPIGPTAVVAAARSIHNRYPRDKQPRMPSMQNLLAPDEDHNRPTREQYYPILAAALARLDDNTAVARRAI